MSFCHGRRGLVKRFGLLLAPFFQSSGLPFGNVLCEQDIQDAADAEGVDFGKADGDIYTPPLTLWTFVSQMLRKGESCRGAVLRLITLLVVLGQRPCSADTGAYCRARAKLTEGMLQRLTLTVAQNLETQAPADWLWCGRHVKLVDGTTVTGPDTEANQAEYPQPRTQKPGLGFPIARMTAVISLATGSLCAMAMGPYRGKQTGETALLRTLHDQFNAGDVVLADRHYCSYFEVALLKQRGVDCVVRLHQRRKTDFGRARRLGKNDYLVQWDRPKKPQWMDDATYATIPQTLLVRQINVQINRPGFRVQELVVVTTLTDARRYSDKQIAELYHYRWHVELDIRAVKVAIGLDELRCKTPEMLRKEIWAHWLAYNLIRKTLAQAALLHGKCPRGLSFTGAQEVVWNCWTVIVITPDQLSQQLMHVHLATIAMQKAGHRPNRVEPREVKGRPKPQKLLKKPRAVAQAQLLAGVGRR